MTTAELLIREVRNIARASHHFDGGSRIYRALDELQTDCMRERRISDGEAALSRGRAEEVAALTDRLQTREEVLLDTADRLGAALTAFETLADSVERDRREPDKVLCHIRSARSALLRAGQRLDEPMEGGERHG